MGMRKILTDEDPALHKVCRPVVKFDEKLHKLLDDMKETLAAANGVGLAAPQVGILRRLFIVDTGEEILEMINPTILETSGEQCGAEGCLSVPGRYGLVKRPYYAKVKAGLIQHGCKTDFGRILGSAPDLFSCLQSSKRSA